MLSSLFPLVAEGAVAAKAPAAPTRRPVASASVKFPSYVANAMAVAAKTTKLPVLGPLWLPDTKAMGRRLMPPHGIFAVTVKASKTRYTMQFWVEAHALPVNGPKVVQDSEDPHAKPITVVSGERYRTARDAAVAVDDNIAVWGPVPKTAQRVAITPNLSGLAWMPQTAGVEVEMIAWRERGWRVEADAFPVPNVKPVTTAVATARTLVPRVMASMPGHIGTLSISTSWRDDDGTATTAMWQRGKLVYSVFAPYGVTSATTVVSSLYPGS